MLSRCSHDDGVYSALWSQHITGLRWKSSRFTRCDYVSRLSTHALLSVGQSGAVRLHFRNTGGRQSRFGQRCREMDVRYHLVPWSCFNHSSSSPQYLFSSVCCVLRAIWCHRQKAADLQQLHHKEKSLSCSGTAMDFTSSYLFCHVPCNGRFRLQPGYFSMWAEVGRPNSNTDINRHISCATWSDNHSKLQSPQSCPSASTRCWNHQKRYFQPRERRAEFKNTGLSEPTTILQRWPNSKAARRATKESKWIATQGDHLTSDAKSDCA